MQVIELLACMGCTRIEDQFTYGPRCIHCNGRYHKAVSATKWTIARWFFTHPKHATKLFIRDLWERYEKRS